MPTQLSNLWQIIIIIIIKFCTERRVVPCEKTDERMDRKTDRHDEANSRFSKFCKRA
jgi:hypothetical protein